MIDRIPGKVLFWSLLRFLLKKRKIWIISFFISLLSFSHVCIIQRLSCCFL